MNKFITKVLCVDSTHNKAAVDNCRLITLLVVNEQGTGYPVAWAISNKEDINTMFIFMEIISNNIKIY